MNMKYAKAEDFDILQHQEEYAKASGNPDATSQDFDYVGELESLREMLIRKRRYLVHDVAAYPIAYMGRALDIARLQPVIDQIEAAIEHERKLSGKTE